MNKHLANIDDVIDNGILHVNLKTPRLIYKKFDASNAIADVTLLQNKYAINNASMDFAGGHINLSGSLVSNKDDYHQAKVIASLDNVDVNTTFSCI